MVEVVKCGEGKKELTQGLYKVALDSCRNKNKGHVSSHLPPMARNRAALGMPSINTTFNILYNSIKSPNHFYSSILANGIKIQSKISQIAGTPNPLLLAFV